ncbi:hypothetical protein KRX19_03450 [Cardiobacteriaceae bacterium TAE3-ERU3]|nr:hypothetical protein [Cardiobacteriaceae bacterium TAE3-ERU3]
MNMIISADWVNAYAALFAVIFAAYATYEARRLYKLEQQRDRDAEEEKKRAQASKISAWIGADIPPLNALDKSWKGVGVIIQNQSDTPIFDVVIELLNSEKQAALPINIDILPPGYYFCLAKHKGSYADFLTPEQAEHNKDAWEYAIPLSQYPAKLRPITMSRKRCIISISFTDSNNHRWQRDTLGKLTLLDS